MEKFKGLEEAKTQFNKWQGRAVIFLDFDDMTAWTEVHEIPDYHSANIVKLVGKDDLYGRNDRYGIERLETLAKAKLEKWKKGWDKAELCDNGHMDFAKIIAGLNRES